MSEEEQLIAHFEKSRSEYEATMKELIPVRMKIAMEGLSCDLDHFEIAPELKLRRASLEERQAFYSRTNNPKDIEIKAKDNEFFAEFDFDIPRGSVYGLAPSNGITLISIFFTIFAPKVLNINKGKFYLVNGVELNSAGFHTCPDEYRFASNVVFSKEDLQDFKTLWPLFKEQFEENFSFALVARRYYYSLLRLKPEDRMIDLIIALEALLVPEKNGSKKDKIARRLAQMIYPQFDPSEVRALSEEAYRLRNKIVHGGTVPHLESFDIKLMSKFCRTGIRRYLTDFRGISKRKLISVLDAVQTEGDAS